MQDHRRAAGIATVCLCCVVMTGCGSESSNPVASPHVASLELDVVSSKSMRADGKSDSIPDTVTVTQPALIDTNARPADLPIWPGPHPTEFLAPTPQAGAIGELTGELAGKVSAAAQKNPSELWNVGGVVLWLVVT